MTPPTDHTPLVAAMLDPGFYPHRPAAVELRETHVSWVFLAGGLAYKVKKPVTFPFLDYGTLERRRELCHEEVRLNRRLAPRIYLGVVAIARRDGAYALADEAAPDAIEYAVKMRAVDERRSLAALAARGELDDATAAAVGRRIAAFHAASPPAPPPARELEVLVATLDENLTTLEGAGAGLIGELELRAARRFTEAFLDRRGGELRARGERGLVRDGHGDLRAEHVIVPEHDPLYIYDCIEFDPALREIDVAADLAFLVMDLARLGAEPQADALVAAYREAGGDPGDDALVAFFASYRAWVRAKIAALRTAELGPGDPEAEPSREEARRLFALGRRFAWRARGPLVLLVGGVTGAGKSTLASGLAQLTGAPHLSSDLVRKRLAGLPPEARGEPWLYSGEQTERTYRALGEAAREALAERGVAIADATFHRRAARDAFRAGLGDVDAELVFVWCEAPAELLAERVARRLRDPARVSDADLEVLESQLANREPPDELPRRSLVTLDTRAEPGRLLAELELAIDRIAAAPGRGNPRTLGAR